MEKPTLKKYWEANSSVEREKIIENAFNLIDNLERQLIIHGVNKSFKIELQTFDLCDCPYQINTWIEKYNIQANNIISINKYDKKVVMFYKCF